MYQLNAFNPQQFLQQNWQKQPLLIRGGFPGFVDLLDEHDLAGLAQEPDIDARIVSRQGNNWQVAQGPFGDFAPHCHGQWSLLVQGVDLYLDEATELLNAFNFIPRWRIDDLMVSYSVPGAGVGPHLDQYDVFIIQGKGRRHWQVGDKGQYTEHRPHPLLGQVEAFEPIIDVVLEPGDILYIPPGFPHCGEAIEPSLNYSVGFRAPNQQDLLSSLADFALQQEGLTQRYQDPDLKSRALSGEVLSCEVEKIRALLQASLQGPAFTQWVGSFLSRGPQEESFEDGELPLHALFDYLQSGQPLQRRLDYKGVWLQTDSPQVQLHLGELNTTLDQHLLPYLEPMLSQACWEKPDNLADETLMSLCQAILPLVNAGVWEPIED